jgi:hypothetical protein
LRLLRGFALHLRLPRFAGRLLPFPRHILRRLRTTLATLAILRGSRRLACTRRCGAIVKLLARPGRRRHLLVATRRAAFALHLRGIGLPRLARTHRGPWRILSWTRRRQPSRRTAGIVTTRTLPG